MERYMPSKDSVTLSPGMMDSPLLETFSTLTVTPATFTS